ARPRGPRGGPPKSGVEGAPPPRHRHHRDPRGERRLPRRAVARTLRRRARGRALLEPGRAPPQSRREVAAGPRRPPPAPSGAANHPGRRGLGGEARRAGRLRGLLPRTPGKTGGDRLPPPPWPRPAAPRRPPPLPPRAGPA